MWSSSFWQNAFTSVGVAAGNASAWAPLFAAIDDSSFRQGRSELVQFLAQITHETGKLKTLTENLNYSVAGLVATFGLIRCPQAIANQIGRIDVPPYSRVADQRAIANQVYGGQWGLKNLGNKGPDDGWNYRGSGLLQCTGLDNFLWLETTLKLPFTSNPNLLRTVCAENLRASIALWGKRVKVEHLGDDVAVRKDVNGGNLGLDDCVALRKQYAALIV